MKRLFSLNNVTLRHGIGLLTAAAVLCCSPVVHATIDDAHSFAMEAASPFVEQGFIVREDYWNGEVKSEQKLMIRHQLFKGNEYAFWLGTANDGVEFELKVVDENDKEITIDRKTSAMFCSVRVNPPKTGTYSIIFSLKAKEPKGVYWALAYGYR